MPLLCTGKVLDSAEEQGRAVMEASKAMVAVRTEQPAYLSCLMVMVNMQSMIALSRQGLEVCKGNTANSTPTLLLG